MMGPDGQGWIGTDANGNRVYKSNEQLRREAEQERADKLRDEKLYIAEDYGVFFLTKQPGTQAGADAGRKAYISIKPFNSLPAGAVSQMRAKAEPWDAQKSNIRIEHEEPLLAFHDDVTKTRSTIFVGELDPAVRNRLRGNAETEKAWGQFFNAAAEAPQPQPGGKISTTVDDVQVRRRPFQVIKREITL